MMSCMEGSTKTSLTNGLNREGPSNYANSPTNIQDFEKIPVARAIEGGGKAPDGFVALVGKKTKVDKSGGGGGGQLEQPLKDSMLEWFSIQCQK